MSRWLACMLLGCSAASSPEPPRGDACAACTDSSVDVRTDVADVADDVADAKPPSRVPPKRPGVTGTGTTKWYAFKRLQLGLTRRADGLPDSSAWKEYGYNLDGRTTTGADSASNVNHCKRHEAASSDTLVDGAGGSDNNFGQHVSPVIKALRADAEEFGDSEIRNGRWTILLRLDNVGPLDNAKVPGAMYIGHGAIAPAFDETDDWTISNESLSDGVDIAKPRMNYPGGYMAGGVWVSGDLGKSTIPVSLVMFGVVTVFPLESGVITVRVADGSEGTIAGATSTKELLDAFDPVLRTFGLCPGTPTYSLAQNAVIRSADLVSRAPSLQDPTKSCDALSSGLGFTMARTGAPTKVAPLPPAPADPCGP